MIELRVRGSGTAFSSGYRERDAASGVVATAPAGTPGTPPTLVAAPVISGSLRVGATVTPDRGRWTGTEPIQYRYAWSSCVPGGSCRGVSAATSYRLRAADAGRTIRMAVIASNAAGTTTAVAQAGPVGSAAAGLRRLSPFPTLLIDGRVAGNVTTITTMRLRRVAGGSTINLSCTGRGCPFRKSRLAVRGRQSRNVRIAKLQRRFRAGTVVVITVRKGNTLGKYTRLRFRGGSVPARVDRCVMPKSSKPVGCG